MAKVPNKTDDTPEEGLPGKTDGPNKTVEPEKVETVEDQGIGPQDPYPTGNPPPPKEGGL